MEKFRYVILTLRYVRANDCVGTVKRVAAAERAIDQKSGELDFYLEHLENTH
jgi:hypothetical protein